MDPAASPVLPYATTEPVYGRRMLTLWALIAGLTYVLQAGLSAIQGNITGPLPLAQVALSAAIGTLLIVAASPMALPPRLRQRCVIAAMVLNGLLNAVGLSWVFAAMPISALALLTCIMGCVNVLGGIACFALLGWMFLRRCGSDANRPEPGSGLREEKAIGVWLVLWSISLGVNHVVGAVMLWTTMGLRPSSLPQFGSLALIAMAQTHLLAACSPAMLVAAIAWLTGRRWARPAALAIWAILALVLLASSAISARGVLLGQFDMVQTISLAGSSIYMLNQLFTWLVPLWVAQPVRYLPESS